MKIAIFHNYMDNIGGAEIVALTLARELGADIFTTNIDHDKIKKMGFSGIKIFSIGKVPLNAPFKQQFAFEKFKRFKTKKRYDFYIIDGDWAMSGALKNKPNLWYVHSPIREIWDLYRYTRKNNVPWFLRYIFDIWVYYNRYQNKKILNHVDHLVCNSKNTKKRIKKYLKKEATVVHPPIDIKIYRYKKDKGYWLSVNRLITHKRVDMQIRAFEDLPDEKLIIVGSYERSRHFLRYARYIKKIKPKNVKILHWVNNKTLKKLYSECKGFITTSKDEDFGMAPVEAMASGKPVIAPYEGGYKETVIAKKTGFLIKDITPNKIIKAVKDINKTQSKYKKECINQAKRFDASIFIKKIKKIIKGHDDKKR